MSTLLPLFPLGTVLYPGMVLPLHVFEDRYRRLVRDLLALPEPRQFGVIAIREGRETGIDGVSALHEIGCTATLRQVEPHPDGRFDMVVVGAERFRLIRLLPPDDAVPYYRGQVEPLPDETGTARAGTGQAGTGQAGGEAAALAVRASAAAFRAYLDALAERGGATVVVHDLPDEPVLLSYVVAAAMLIDLPERQALLAEPDALSRLAAERALLSRETGMLRTTTSRPAPHLRYAPYSPN